MLIERLLFVAVVLLGIVDICHTARIRELSTRDEDRAANVERLHADLRKLLRELEIDQGTPEELPPPEAEPEPDLFDPIPADKKT